jgi:hypothetical protein
LTAILPTGPGNLAREPEATSIQDPRRETEQQRFRWEIRAAQWRALEIARAIWGESVSASLSGYGSRGAFRGLLHLEVPLAGGSRFDLELHREREDAFTRAAGRDPVLERIPLVYLLDVAAPRDASA